MGWPARCCHVDKAMMCRSLLLLLWAAAAQAGNNYNYVNKYPPPVTGCCSGTCTCGVYEGQCPFPSEYHPGCYDISLCAPECSKRADLERDIDDLQMVVDKIASGESVESILDLEKQPAKAKAKDAKPVAKDDIMVKGGTDLTQWGDGTDLPIFDPKTMQAMAGMAGLPPTSAPSLPSPAEVEEPPKKAKKAKNEKKAKKEKSASKKPKFSKEVTMNLPRVSKLSKVEDVTKVGADLERELDTVDAG